MVAALTATASTPQVPLSTGGLEALIDRQVKRLLTFRRTAFGNIERTNILVDLVVAASTARSTTSEPPRR